MADLDFQLLIQSDANLKGFHKAEVATGKLADQANKAAPKTDKLAKATKKVGVDAGFTGARVATLANEMLRWTGMGAQGTAVSTALSSGFTAAGDAGKYLGAAIGGVTIAVAFLLPKIVEWVGQNDKLRKEVDELVGSLTGEKQALEDIVALLGDKANPAFKALFDVLKSKSLLEQAEKIQEYNDKLTASKNLVAEMEENLKAMGRQTNIHTAGLEDHSEAEAKLAEKILDAKVNNEILRRSLDEMIAAQSTGMTVSEFRTKALEDEAAATDTLRQATEEWFATQGRNQNVDIETYNLRAELADQQAKDADDDMDAETKRQEDAARDRTRADTQATLRRMQNQRDIANLRRQLAAQERQDQAAGVANFTAAASSLFGKNKGLAIASALADTYAGANAAFAQTPGPVWVKAAAAALAVALGLANVQSIESSSLGFDDPVNDLLAAKLGRKFATDVLSHINAGFGAGLTDLSGGARGSSVQNYSRTTNNAFHLGGFFGTSETQLLKQLNRKLIKANRLEARTKLGSS